MPDFTYSTITGSPTQPVNYISYPVGGRFINGSGVDVVVTQLGRWCAPLNNQAHTLTAYNASNVDIGHCTVNMSGQPSGDFVWGAVHTGSFTIPPGGEFYIISTETGGSEIFYASGGLINTVPFGTIYIGSRQGGTLSSTYPSNPSETLGPVSFKYSAPVADWTKQLINGHYLYDCAIDQYSVNSARADASPGDTVKLRGGSVTWGTAGSYVTVNKAITIDGNGTVVAIANTAGTYSNPGVINITGAGATVANFVFNQSGTANTTAITAAAANFRITGCTYNDNWTSDPWNEGYFVYATAYGLIDNCTLTTGYGQAEPFFIRGPSDSWQTAHSMGTANAVFIEDVTWNGKGYTDANSNARMVVRFCTFNETAKKIDAHGYSTNQPRVGVRQTEAYMNAFTGTGGNYAAVEIRGGNFRGFFNTSKNNSASFDLVDYGYLDGGWWATTWQTPLNYPFAYQIGTGRITASTPVTSLTQYRWSEIDFVGTTNWTTVGASSSSVGIQFNANSSAPGTGTGTSFYPPATEPAYIFGNTRNGSVWPVNNRTPSAGAIALYRSQTGNPSATFDGTDIIRSNRDYFADAGAAANTGVVIGLGSSKGSAAGKTGQGYWATDEGSWNTRFSGTVAASSLGARYWCEITTLGNTNWQAIGAPVGATVGTQFRATGAGSGTGFAKPAHGRLYVSDGTNWNLDYTPFTYPHPLAGSTPTVISASTNGAGNVLSLGLSESCTTGAGGNGGITVSASGGAVTATYLSGSGTATYNYTLSRPISSSETISASYVQPGNGIESTATQADLSSFSGLPVMNGSASGSTINFTVLNVTNLVVS